MLPLLKTEKSSNKTHLKIQIRHAWFSFRSFSTHRFSPRAMSTTSCFPLLPSKKGVVGNPNNFRRGCNFDFGIENPSLHCVSADFTKLSNAAELSTVYFAPLLRGLCSKPNGARLRARASASKVCRWLGLLSTLKARCTASTQ